MKTIPRYLVLAALLSFVLPAFASARGLSFTQSSSGAVSAVFSSGPCAFGLNPLAPSSAALNANQFSISSPFAVWDPIPNCNSTLFPSYTVTALLGVIPDGHYTVIWVYGSAQVTGEFDIISGILQSETLPAPSSSRVSLLGLIALLTAITALVTRRA